MDTGSTFTNLGPGSQYVSPGAQNVNSGDGSQYNANTITFHQHNQHNDANLLADLRVTDPRDDKTRIEDTKGGLLTDSYVWVLQNPDFCQWRDDKDQRLLWVKGDPGKGKTMLLCGIIDDLQATRKGKPLSYFFCQATHEQLNTATAVLRGLIFMLLSQDPSLASHIKKQVRSIRTVHTDNTYTPTNWGTTPLQMTANQFRGHLADDHAQVLDLLLRGGAAVDEPAGQDRRTALHRAVATGTAQAVEMLLARGASPTLRDGSGRDARALAVEDAARLTRDGGKVLDRRIDDHVEIMERLFADKKREWPMNRGRCLVDVLCDDPGIDGKRIFGELFEMGLQKNAKFGDKGTIADLYSKVPPYKDPSRRAL
ncbi:nacht and wd domain protein [Colletotrichum sojae]|uniref:Nacht and wd domain protein n=1 Tax=Colletotrichum sojae TaxID=2175907 RepID=A0A8H6IN29_9PEZI|nr:nacht and wd domain protein [Colletotrichum sojae]